MKKLSIMTIFMFLTLIAVYSVYAQTETSDESMMEAGPAFTVERMVIAGSVEDREPVGTVDVFPSVTEKVYCFLEARNITEDTMVSFVWYYQDKEMAKVDLPLKEGPRWRTYSSKKLAGLEGTWKVELHDAEGNVVNTIEFTVE